MMKKEVVKNKLNLINKLNYQITPFVTLILIINNLKIYIKLILINQNLNMHINKQISNLNKIYLLINFILNLININLIKINSIQIYNNGIC
jgi:hypothetical protein